MPDVRLEPLTRVSCRPLSGQCRRCVLRSVAGREARVVVEGELPAFVEGVGDGPLSEEVRAIVEGELPADVEEVCCRPLPVEPLSRVRCRPLPEV